MSVPDAFANFYGWLEIIMNFINNNKIMTIMLIFALLSGAVPFLIYLWKDRN